MKLFKRFLLLLCAVPSIAGAQVATTAGSNLTGWNGNVGATNNNNWNQLMNSRAQVSAGAPTADFGNCNSLILRCAQPKCAGCNSMEVARPIVAGCVNSNTACKKYGDDLIEFISAQMVSNAANKAQQQQIAAQQAAAQQAAAQNNAQIQQMQQQMQQMQYEMQQQNAQQMAQMQAALEEQKALTASAMESAAQSQQQQVNQSAGTSVSGAGDSVASGVLTDSQIAAAQQNIETEILLRQQISGDIKSSIEAAEIAMKSLKAEMQNVFSYARCDARGGNCAGPKRVATFKRKAQAFFDPYDAIVDELYDALEKALMVGVDVSDVVMMLSGGCNQWAKFMCTGDEDEHLIAHYDDSSCKNQRSVKGAKICSGNGKQCSTVSVGGLECSSGMAVPPQADARCRPVDMISEDDDAVLRDWLSEAYDGDRLIRVGCATDVLESVSFFGRRKSRSNNTVDLDVLERIIAQDAPEYSTTTSRWGNTSDEDDGFDKIKYCGLTEKGYQNLLKAVKTKKLPSKICVPYKQLEHDIKYGGLFAYDGTGMNIDQTVMPLGEDSCKDTSVYGKWVKGTDSNCSLQWNQNDKICKIGGDCIYDGNKIWKKADYEKMQRDANTSAAVTTGGLSKTECELVYGGDYNDTEKRCFCGGYDLDWRFYKCCKGKTYNSITQECDNGTIKSKTLLRI